MFNPGICLALAALLYAGCGYVGDPQPPALHIPRRVTDLRAFQHAGQVIVADGTLAAARRVYETQSRYYTRERADLPRLSLRV